MRHRPERVASVIQRVVGEAIAAKLADPRISRLTSVTRVQVSRDLRFADVYVSVLGEAAEARTSLRGLQAAHGRIQSLVADALPIRQAPIVRFKLDESIKRSFETLRLIEQSVGEMRQHEAPKANESCGPASGNAPRAQRQVEEPPES